MAPRKIMKVRDKKIQTVIMLEQGEVTFLDRKIDPNDAEKRSRSAIVRRLIRRAMEKGEV